MRSSHQLPLRLRSLFHRQQVKQDLNQEFQFHLQSQIEEYVAQQ